MTQVMWRRRSGSEAGVVGATGARRLERSVPSRRIIILVSGVRVPPPLPNYTFIINYVHPIPGWASLSRLGPGYHLGYQSAPRRVRFVMAVADRTADNRRLS